MILLFFYDNNFEMDYSSSLLTDIDLSTNINILTS
jgi:hypothetical protein